MLSMFEAVLFDFDGTLVPSLDLHDLKRRVVDFIREHRIISEAEVEASYAVELIEATAVHLTQTGANGEQFRQQAHALVRSIEVEAATQNRPYAGVRDLLTQLAAAGVAIGIVTRNCREAVGIMFPDLREYCGSILTRDDVLFLKPDPRHLEQCLLELNSSGRASVMVGDGALDMSTGRKLGMYCVGVLGGHCDEPTLIASGAQQTADKVTDLVTVLEAAAR